MTSGQARFPVAPSIFKFKPCGQSGIMMSDLVPHMHSIADDITMIKSVHTDGDQSRSRLHVRDDRQRSTGQAEPRFVAQLWTWQRKQRSARLRRVHANISTGVTGSSTLHAHVEQRIFTQQFRWRRTSRCGRSGAVHQEPARCHRPRPSTDARCAESIEPTNI